MIYKFNNIEIDSETYRLLDNKKETSVEPQVFNLIIFLIENKNKIISRDEILDNLWKGRVVSDTSINSHIKSARKVLGDDGAKQAVIKTIHSRGYQFIAKINNKTLENKQDKIFKQQSDGPIIAVLPLKNLSSDVEQEYFAQGISEDLTSELFKFNNIQVIARHSAFHYKNEMTNLSKLRKDLAVDYIIEGSIRKIKNKIRLNIQLVDVIKNKHVWTQKYDDLLTNIYDIIDDIIEQIVSTVSNEIMRVETNRSLKRNTKNLRAFDHFLRGLHYHKITDDQSHDNSKAVVEFKKAVKLDPKFARAKAWYTCAVFSTWKKVTNELLEENLIQVKIALQQNQNDQDIHRILGAIYFNLKNHTLAEHHFKQALKLSPNDTNIMIKAAAFYAFVGDHKKTRSLSQRAFFLNPRHPSWYWRELGIIRYCLGEYENAIQTIQKNIHCSEYDYALCAAFYSALKDHDNAQEQANLALKFNSKASAEIYTQYETFKDKEKHKLLVKRMIAAGINP